MTTDSNATRSSAGHHDDGPLSDGHYDEAATKQKLRAAIKLLAAFCVVYFVAAMISTPELAHIARIEILGLPLAFYTGLLVFAVGLVVTRICLNQDKG